MEPEKTINAIEKIKTQIFPKVIKINKEDIISETLKNKDFNYESVGSNISEIISAWDNILKVAKKYDRSVGAFLKLSTPKEIKKDLLIITTPYKFHTEKLNESKNCQIVKKAIAEILPKTLGMKIQVIQDENIEK